ncbi:MAG: CRISPR-associated endonuclease Cas1 [Bacteroidota bacterium]
MQLILDTKGLKLLRKRGSFLVEPPEGKGQPRLISAKKLSSIAITATVLISSDAVRLAIQQEVPILFFDRIGKAEARLWSPYFGSIATLRRQQVRFAESPAATRWIIQLYQRKAEEQVRNLRYLSHRREGLAEPLDQALRAIERQARQLQQYQTKLLAEVRNSLMGNEGSAARQYWQSVASALPPEYQFAKRSRRPAEDLFNAALNYLYGMLYSVVESGLFAAGLDPHLGLLHADEYRKPVLAFDLIEPFRPWVERLLIDECLLHTLESSYVTANQYGLFLNKQGKAYLIPLFNEWLRSTRRHAGRETSVRNHIYTLAAKLAQRVRTFETEEGEEVDPDLPDG